jgi:polyferredoxin/Pyruvate/2-oxoacid:ferredoxin oxidoreductase delta subunit
MSASPPDVLGISKMPKKPKRRFPWFDGRITQVRIISQTFFLVLFLFLVVVSDLRYLKGYPVSLFLEIDPLVSLATALSTSTVYRGLILSLWVIIPTVLLGRVFCNWVCPFGTLHQLTAAFPGGKDQKQRLEANRFASRQQVKYLLLAGFLVMAALGSLQIGLLDPISLLHRSVNTAGVAGVDAVAPGTVHLSPFVYSGTWLIGALLFLLLALNRFYPRFFCRVLCPLGALLGLLSRFSLFRIHRDPQRCIDCDLCLQKCQGACDPHTFLRQSECFVCFECIEACPYDALQFKFMPGVASENEETPVPGRRAVMAGLLGLAGYSMLRGVGTTSRRGWRQRIRPPGSLVEAEFLQRCLKCDQCLRVCPTNVLQPAGLEAGLEGMWTPVLDMERGYCELNCTLCGQVCPTGAIQPISLDAKTGRGEFATQGPVRLGTAFYDRGRCLPWAMDTPCVVCEEVCPVSPKAIYTREVTVSRRDGSQITLKRPYVDPSLCIGCGICQNACPVEDQAAVRVSPIGETRSKDRQLMLRAEETGVAEPVQKPEPEISEAFDYDHEG